METSSTPTTLRDFLHEFARLAPLQREYRPASMDAYTHWIEEYVLWIGDDAHLDAFCAERLRKFRNHLLLDTEYRPRTRGLINTSLRTFGSWLVEEGYLDANPAEVLGKVKLDAPKRRVVSEADSRALLAACERLFDPRRRIYYRAVLCVLTYAALRRSELLDLHVEDFQEDIIRPGSYKLFVREGKGGGSRDVPICDDAARAIAAWIPLRAKTTLPNLFITTPRGPLSENGLRGVLKRLCHLAECSYANPHSFRHGLITRLLLAKEDLKTVSELAGHKNTSTTLNVYYHTTDARKREVADRASLAPLPPPTTPAPIAPAASEQDVAPPLRLITEESA